MVLLIMAILAGFMLVSFHEIEKHQAIEEPVVELQKLARRANRTSASFRTEYRIRFEPERFFIVPTQQEAEKEQIEGFELEDGVAMQIRRWRQSDWTEPAPEDWIFAETGIAEPISVRFSRNQAYVELDFNPLTATVEEKRSYLP